jgi:hypothetical protein
MSMYLTIVQTPTFVRSVEAFWDHDDVDNFINYIAQHGDVGDVIPGTGGLRKIRWHVQGRGKRGGARVIYAMILENGEIWLLLGYTKSKFDNLPSATLKRLKDEITHKKT